MSTALRHIPSIERLRQREDVQTLESRYGRLVTLDALRDEAARLRDQVTAGDVTLAHADEGATWIATRLEDRIRNSTAPSLVPVVNATGVIVHTNLGRAPLSAAALARLRELGAGYSNLEYDVAGGHRGSRTVHAAGLLQRLTGAEDATVVNNNAAAVLLVLAALAYGREVLISRGEMVEIGGGFRIPDVLRQSGAVLREIGTTNRTRAADYAAAISDRTALILRVHPSNFAMAGFTERPALADVVAIGASHDVQVVEDLGSGLLIAHEATRSEPTVRESVEAGVSICTFSGDKLLGGPQAGIIVGRKEALALIRSHPLMRAVRVDKLTLAALESTLLEHLSGRGPKSVPVVRMISVGIDTLEARARAISDQLASLSGLTISIVPTDATIGGGSTPGVTIRSCALAITAERHTAASLDTTLRRRDLPVIGRIEDDHLLLDLRTIDPSQDGDVVEAVRDLDAGLANADRR